MKHQIVRPEFQSVLALAWVICILLPLGLALAAMVVALVAGALQ